jgi:uncharacterized protein YndB with AHSA1/START domain
MPVTHASFVIDKTYPHRLAKVFAAFAEPSLRAKWQSPDGGARPGDHIEFEFKVGARESARWVMGDDTPFPGAVISSEGLFLDILDQQRIVSASNMMMNGTPFSGSLLSFEFTEDHGGTRLTCTHQGAFFENSDGSDMRKDGWEKLLISLAAFLDNSH